MIKILFRFRSLGVVLELLEDTILKKLVMSSPFPGMNPYLEHPTLWSGIHHRLITAIANDLAPKIRPNYIAAIEERVYEMGGEASLLVGIPDVSVQSSQKAVPRKPSSVTSTAQTIRQPTEVTLPFIEALTEGYLEIRSVETGEVITAIEVLSPKNKQSVVGRLQYETKRQKILRSDSHLVEIDLLRQGKSMPILETEIDSDYQILVSRSNIRPKAELYSFNLQDKIPQFILPLRSEDTEPIVDLQTLLHEIYDQGGYDLRLDYSRSTVPTLSNQDAVWVDELLKHEGLR